MSDAKTVLDADALARLRELDPGGQGRIVERILRAYAQSANKLGEQARGARERGDVAGIRHVAHTLKSSSASIGATALAKICDEIETSVRNEATAGLADRLDAMDRELASVLQAVTTLLPSSSPLP